MARAEYIFETNSVNGGFLVDRRTDQIVGTTSRGVDRYFVNGETNQLTGGVDLTTGGKSVGAKLGAAQITYDTQGRVSTHDAWTMTYDASGRASSQTNGTQTQTFNYDTSGRFTGITEA